MWRFNIRVHPLSLAEDNLQLRLALDDLHAQICSLVLENNRLNEQNIFLKSSDSVLEFQTLHMENKEHIAKLEDVRGLLRDKVGRMQDKLEMYRARIQTKETESKEREGDLKNHIFKLQGMIESLQDANNLKAGQLHQLGGKMESLQDANNLKAGQLQRLEGFAKEIKELLTCSITTEVMKEPCILSTGHMFERESISKWVRENGTCPHTRNVIGFRDFNPYASIPALRNVCRIVAEMC
jgi:DNA repair exonuclease SbcCD ATPase subunit